MNKIKKMALIVFLTLVGSTPMLHAQTFDPDNPADPQTPVFKTYYTVSASVTPKGAGSVSGKGKYEEGEKVTLRTSAVSGYTFKCWTKNGAKYSESMTCEYEVTESADFIAVYEYAPNNPSDPARSSKLFLECEPEGICSFNITNGETHEMGEFVAVEAYGDRHYEFLGWYKGSEFLGKAQPLSVMMPEDGADLHLTAKFVYNYVFNPVNPGDPGMNEKILGDVDGNGEVNVSDVVELVNAILAGRTGLLDLETCDMNKDGSVDISDAVEIVNYILKGAKNEE